MHGVWSNDSDLYRMVKRYISSLLNKEHDIQLSCFQILICLGNNALNLLCKNHISTFTGKYLRHIMQQEERQTRWQKYHIEKERNSVTASFVVSFCRVCMWNPLFEWTNFQFILLDVLSALHVQELCKMTVHAERIDLYNPFLSHTVVTHFKSYENCLKQTCNWQNNTQFYQSNTGKLQIINHCLYHSDTTFYYSNHMTQHFIIQITWLLLG